MTKPIKHKQPAEVQAPAPTPAADRQTELTTASELRYRRLFEAAQDGILILDAATGMIVDVNPFLTALLGYSHEQFLGKKIWELGFFRDIIANQDNFAELRQKEYVRYEDLPLETADGRRIEVEFISNVYLVDKEKVIQCNIRDITERKRVEEALKISEERFRTAAMSLNDIVYEWDLKETLVWYGNIDGIMGYPPQGFPRTFSGWAETLHPEDTERVWKAVEEQLKGATPYAVEYRIRNKIGDWRWWSARGTALRNGREEPYKWIGSISDITDRKQAEEDLHTLAFRYETLLAAVPEIIMEVDHNKIYIWANQAGKEFFGDEVIGKEADFYFEGEQETYQKVQPLFKGDENTIYLESRQRRKDGAKRLLSWRCRMLRDGHDNVTGALSSALDITEDRQNETALQEKLAELERFNRLAVGREERMIELKRQVNELATALGQAPPYDLSFTAAADQPPVRGKSS